MLQNVSTIQHHVPDDTNNHYNHHCKSTTSENLVSKLNMSWITVKCSFIICAVQPLSLLFIYLFDDIFMKLYKWVLMWCIWIWNDVGRNILASFKVMSKNFTVGDWWKVCKLQSRVHQVVSCLKLMASTCETWRSNAKYNVKDPYYRPFWALMYLWRHSLCVP
jgi:hypothetical protein